MIPLLLDFLHQMMTMVIAIVIVMIMTITIDYYITIITAGIVAVIGCSSSR